MILIIAITVITCIAVYFLLKRDNEEKQSFTTECLIGLLLLGICLIPTLILMSVLGLSNALQEYKAVVITMPLLILSFIAVLATHSKSESGSGTDDKKDDFTAEAILLTAVLSENDNSDDSTSSNSSGSSSSSSSSNSDDFFFL